MKNYSWSQFIKRVTIKASPQVIYQAWTTQQGLERWFLRLAEFTSPEGLQKKRDESCQKGDTYKWLWFGYADAIAEQGEILEANGKDELQFSFSSGCPVSVTIKQEFGEILCELKQTMPMSEESDQRYFFIECGKGWTFYLANLKSILEGGIDLRNKNTQIQNVVNA